MNRFVKLASDILKGKPAKLRSPEWPEVEHRHLAEEPACQWCGSRVKLQVHHIAPFHLHPELELDDTNLITLCEEGGDANCHFIHGHDRDWKSFVATVRADCVAHKGA